MPVKAQRSLSLVIATAILGGMLAAPASAQSASYDFDISHQTLSQALRIFAHVSGQDIVFTEDLVIGLTVAPLRGTFTPEAAMQRLLDGTGLVARRSASGALMIVRAATESRDSVSWNLEHRRNAGAVWRHRPVAPDRTTYQMRKARDGIGGNTWPRNSTRSI